jgi:hypothetical protein
VFLPSYHKDMLTALDGALMSCAVIGGGPIPVVVIPAVVTV